jgi:hypothetical protein
MIIALAGKVRQPARDILRLRVCRNGEAARYKSGYGSELQMQVFHSNISKEKEVKQKHKQELLLLT